MILKVTLNGNVGIKLCVPQSILIQKDKVTIEPSSYQGCLETPLTSLILTFNEPKGGDDLLTLVNEALKFDVTGGVTGVKDITNTVMLQVTDVDNHIDLSSFSVSAVMIFTPSGGPGGADKQLTGSKGFGFDFSSYSTNDWIKMGSIGGTLTLFFRCDHVEWEEGRGREATISSCGLEYIYIYIYIHIYMYDRHMHYIYIYIYICIYI
jgi:hypothetical protein